MGGLPCARLFPILIAGTAMKWYRVQLRPHRCQELGLIYFLEGHLNHHHHAAYSSPLLSLFFFLSFFKNLYFTFAVTLGFLQGNKSVSQCNKTKLFFLSLLPEHSETFYEHLFLSATVAKKTPTKQQREEEMRQKSPSCKCQGLPVEPTERWPFRSCQGLTRTLEWFGLERLKLVSFQPSTKPGLKSYLNLALSRLSPWLAVEFAVLYF